MSRPYKARNKRIIPRGAGGRFRRTTMADIGGGCCEKCGRLYALDFDSLKGQPFIDPFDMAKIKRFCPACREEEPNA